MGSQKEYIQMDSNDKSYSPHKNGKISEYNDKSYSPHKNGKISEYSNLFAWCVQTFSETYHSAAF